MGLSRLQYRENPYRIEGRLVWKSRLEQLPPDFVSLGFRCAASAFFLAWLGRVHPELSVLYRNPFHRVENHKGLSRNRHRYAVCSRYVLDAYVYLPSDQHKE